MGAVSLGLVQMRCEKGAIDANLAAMETYVHAAAERGTEIVCFPEASITGYVSAATDPDALVAVDGPEVARFVALTRSSGITALAGIIERTDNARPFITQIVARAGAVLAVYRKLTIPDEETHLYTPGRDTAPVWRHPFRSAPESGVLCSTAICADIADSGVFAAGAARGARLIFEAAAPGLYGEQATRDWRSGYAWWRDECHTKLGSYAREFGVTIAVATQAGRTRDEDFPGGGYIFRSDGACVAESGDWSEGVLYATVEVG